MSTNEPSSGGTDGVTELDREVLRYLDGRESGAAPGVVAVELDRDLSQVHESLDRLCSADLVDRIGWATCAVNDRGREVARG